jgi:cytochrome c oxidase subunit 3
MVRRPSLLTVGTIVWLASELMFFSGLFAAYFTLRANVAVWPPTGYKLDQITALAGTLLLVISSGSMQWAVHDILLGRRKAFLGWLTVTWVLGVGFVVIQGFDWAGRNFSIHSSAYGSAFYVLTGFHGLHVIGGLLAMIIMGARAKSPGFVKHSAPAVEMLSFYWHFVDVVWIALYSTIFLLK